MTNLLIECLGFLGFDLDFDSSLHIPGVLDSLLSTVSGRGTWTGQCGPSGSHSLSSLICKGTFLGSFTMTYFFIILFLSQQAKRLKSCKRRPEVNRLDGRQAQWLIGVIVNRLDV